MVDAEDLDDPQVVVIAERTTARLRSPESDRFVIQPSG